MPSVQKIYDLFLSGAAICTDSRSLTPGCIFFALKGGNFDGNKFAAHAVDEGAALAVIDDHALGTSDKFLLVDNVVQALQELARRHRAKLNIPVIAVTGSN